MTALFALSFTFPYNRTSRQPKSVLPFPPHLTPQARIRAHLGPLLLLSGFALGSNSSFSPVSERGGERGSQHCVPRKGWGRCFEVDLVGRRGWVVVGLCACPTVYALFIASPGEYIYPPSHSSFHATASQLPPRILPKSNSFKSHQSSRKNARVDIVDRGRCCMGV